MKRMKKRIFRLPPVGWLALAIVCLAAVQGGLYLLESSGAVWDMTPDALTTLSEGTIDTLGRLEEDVCIHLVFQEDTASQLRQNLDILTASYARAGRVTVDAIDPVTEPGRIRAFAESGKTIAEGSVIVTNADASRYAVVAARDMYTYAVTASGSYALTGFAAEQKITSAIRTVTGEDQKRVWFLSGHDEAGMADCAQLVSRLEADNYAVGEISLSQAEELQGGDVLLLLSPARDLTEDEAAALDAFLRDGGRLLLACDASLDMGALPRVADVAAGFSLTFAPGMVVEDERMTGYWMNSPLYLMPAIQTGSEALSSLKESQRVILPGARAVTGPDIPLSGYTYEPLLLTSAQSYICPLDSESIARDDSMPVGAQQLAVSVSHVEEATGAEMHAVLMGSLYALVDNSLLNATYNLDMSVAVIGYLAQREETAAVPVRSVTDTSMPAMTAQEGWQALAVTLTLPVLAVLAGAIVLIRRRKK